jgi:hypothetical protein
MDEKISQKAIDQYSEAYASKIVSAFFNSREKITGPEILDLCDIKQVNLFVLRELMHVWTVESQKLKSPYFNYQAKEVMEAMHHFQNTLSNHISISRSDFLPLLKNAVGQALSVVLSPYDFYSNTLDRQGKGFINVNDLRSDIKYLKINQPPLEKLVQKLEEKKLTTVSGNEAFALLDSILEEVNFTPEDIETYVEQFSKVVPLEVEKLYESKLTHAPHGVTTKSALGKKPERVAVPLSESRPAGNNFQKTNHIKNSLTINQKFMFTKILFKGDFESFSQAIERLDALDNLGQALGYLETHYAEWDKESEEYQEFLSLVERRFG